MCIRDSVIARDEFGQCGSVDGVAKTRRNGNEGDFLLFEQRPGARKQAGVHHGGIDRAVRVGEMRGKAQDVTHAPFSSGCDKRATIRSAMARHENSSMSRVSGRAPARSARAAATISSSVSK